TLLLHCLQKGINTSLPLLSIDDIFAYIKTNLKTSNCKRSVNMDAGSHFYLCKNQHFTDWQARKYFDERKYKEAQALFKALKEHTRDDSYDNWIEECQKAIYHTKKAAGAKAFGMGNYEDAILFWEEAAELYSDDDIRA